MLLSVSLFFVFKCLALSSSYAGVLLIIQINYKKMHEYIINH